MGNALIVVDVQKDFCEGGRLAVAGGNEVAQRIKQHIEDFGYRYDEIVFTKDWHDPHSDNGGHFSEEPDFVNSWPVHCTANSEGAQLHDALLPESGKTIFTKGFGRPDYSGFQGHFNGQTLGEYLREKRIENLWVVGIAGDYCVRETALDAVTLGYFVAVVPGLVASVNGNDATLKTVEEVYEKEWELWGRE